MKGIKHRFTLSLVANVLSTAISFLIGVLVARRLGASKFGNLQFLTASALAGRGLTDLGTSSTFFTLISQQRRGRRVFWTYFVWLFGQLVFFLFALALLRKANLFGTIWVGQSPSLVALSVISVFAVDALWGTVINVGESVRKTGDVQFGALGAGVTYALFVVWLAARGNLSVASILILNGIIYTAISIAMLVRLLRHDDLLVEGVPNGQDWKGLFGFYLSYCKPLTFLTAVGFLQAFADPWLLQHFAGSRQQGYFSVSQQFSVVSLLAASSYIKVFWKEISEAIFLGNLERARMLFQRSCRLFYFVGSAISAILIPLIPEIIRLVFGDQYAGASLPLAIMLLYPIYQAVGQLSDTFLLATGQVKHYVKLCVCLVLAGMPLSYILMADRAARVPGFGLGAIGLPIKIVVMAMIITNARIYLISRLNKWDFLWKYQIITLGTLLALSTLIVKIVRGVVLMTGAHILGLSLIMVCVFPYVAGVLILLEVAPSLVGLNRAEYLDLREYALGQLGITASHGVNTA